MMSALGGQLVILPSFLCVFLVLFLIKIFHKLWWTPTRLQMLMALQGITGPPYRLIHGNTKEITDMIKEAMSRPRNLSHDVFSVVQPHIHSWTQIYGKNYLQWHGSKAQLIVTDPELCKEILNNKDRAYPKIETPYFEKKLFGDGLLTTTKAEKWAKFRKLATYAFHGESLKSMTPAMVASAETMLEKWNSYEGKEIEVFQEFRLFSSEVISRTAFGSNYIEGKNIFEMLAKLGVLLFKNSLTIRVPVISKFFKTSDEIEADKLEKGLRVSIMEIVKRREEKTIGGEGSFGSDFLGLLLKAYHDTNDDQRISADELFELCKEFYLVAQETTNALLAWTVFLLALHTDWQEEVRKEVVDLFGKQTPNADGIAKLKTMSMVINESLRLYSPVATIIRKTEREVELGKVFVPANLELIVPNLALHHDPQIWGEDVQLFKPERFSDGVAKATDNNVGAFIPFGMGLRSCVGMNFTNIEAKIALSMILQRYSFTLSPGYVHLPFLYLTVRPKHGIQTSMIFYESQRLYPPLDSLVKRIDREIRLGNVSVPRQGNVIVPPNVALVFSNLAFQHDARIWGEDAQLFKLERFAEGIAKATNNNISTIIPFRLGPQGCVELNFATIEAKIALSMILQCCSFTLSPGYVHLPFHYLTVRPQRRIQVMLHSL